LIGRANTAEKKPACISGEGHGPAEDVGGTYGWEMLKAAYESPNPDPEQREKMAWYEKHCMNGQRTGLKNGTYWVWDKAEVNKRLRSLPKLPKPYSI